MDCTTIKKISVILLAAMLLAACSTKPKRVEDIVEMRKQAEAQLDMGNKMSDQGNNREAMKLLDEAQRLARVTDDPSLIIRTSLSRGNVLLILLQSNDALKEFESALSESTRINNRELIAVSRIHISRYNLLADKSLAQTVKDEVTAEIKLIKSDNLYIAFAWRVIGLAENELGNFKAAEAAVMKALAIHEKDRYLEQAAYDWFMIGSFRSQDKNYPEAVEALNQAIVLDRRIENSYGLASNWRALGVVYARMGNAEESRAAYLRSAQIFRGMGDSKTAQETEERIKD